MIHKAITDRGLPKYLRIYKLKGNNTYRLVFVGRYPERKKDRHRWVGRIKLIFGKPNWDWEKEKCLPLPKPDLTFDQLPNRTVRRSILTQYLSIWGLSEFYYVDRDTLTIKRRTDVVRV